jgi:hypothetical protein
LGKRGGKELTYVGKVGAGFTRAVLADLRRKLEAIVTPKSKLSGKVSKPKATWVDPVLVAEVEYRDITSDGYLRHSSFKGAGEGAGLTTRRRPTRYRRAFERPGLLLAFSTTATDRKEEMYFRSAVADQRRNARLLTTHRSRRQIDRGSVARIDQ